MVEKYRRLGLDLRSELMQPLIGEAHGADGLPEQGEARIPARGDIVPVCELHHLQQAHLYVVVWMPWQSSKRT